MSTYEYNLSILKVAELLVRANDRFKIAATGEFNGEDASLTAISASIQMTRDLRYSAKEAAGIIVLLSGESFDMVYGEAVRIAKTHIEACGKEWLLDGIVR